MKAKYFEIREFVSPAVYQRFQHNAWWFIDPRLIESADAIREHFGPMIINDWACGGAFRYRGLRSSLDADAPRGDFSMHRFGRALDAHFVSASVEEVRSYILANQSRFPHIKGLELNVSWLHIDTRNSENLITFRG
ncbi:MAG: hypothetical protein WCY84_00340 [Candidatus Cloacimonadaceae bacterium]